MKCKTIVGILIVLIVCSCNLLTSKGNPQKENNSRYLNSKIGLLIDNGHYRGTVYTDSSGTIHNLRYMPITITNDSVISLHLQIKFEKEYDFPIENSSEKFNLLPMPLEWAIDGGEITDSMIDELPKYINEPIFDKTIEPGEEIIFAIGTFYRRGKTSGVLPKILFVQSDTKTFPECEWLVKKDRPLNQQIPLGLKIVIGEQCLIIPCGSISYLRN